MDVTILLVEDEASLSFYLQNELQFEDYTVITAADGQEAINQFQKYQDDISLIILDWMLPKLDGLEVMRRIRRNYDTPIIMMTARDYIGDKISGLDAGADDYITKPFEIGELLARIRVILRHNNQYNIRDKKYRVGSLTLDTKTRQVFFADQDVQLTQREYDLLVTFMKFKNEVLTRDDLLDLVWGVDFEGQVNIVDVYVRYLRNKIGQFTENEIIETVRGVGYRLRGDE